ncbi:leucine-rich repeat domain-containing protein [Prevotella copri]|uniref:Leucine-rich repeat domain-containing protein n=3 Tax=Segatella copri TaxID=165179 RepID=A0AAW4NE39_9BACT|nr:leucine-rich repeat domain-containing protein [Segatella copri]MBU9912276.1 leucine-rich repeat domain-containing protein [Segatella copri]MBV3409710.1 leucine-rich repeat domain-containing protein [Segatella copri]MBV3445405.1 leucine-rich repeat domain-containing protein [Segatella copri]
MKKIFQYIMLAVVTIVMASCTSDIEEPTATTGKSNVQLIVGEFPAFGDSQTRAIGTPDEGKTSWAEGDELLLEIDNTSYGKQYATFTYNGKSWELTSGELVYREGDPAYIPHVYYAPNYKWEAGKLVLKEGKDPGTDEYIEGNARISGNGEDINVSFAEATRNYSRLRIATMPNKPITVAISKYTPAGSSDMKWDQNYALTSDEKGNAYLYGTFENNSEVTVKYREATLATHTFLQKTENAMSYALDATVISANSAEEIKSAIEQKVADSKTAIRLNLASDAGANEFNAIREAFEKVKSGTIDLTLIGCKEIPANGLNNQSGGLEALKSITLPDVTKIGKNALLFCVDLEEICAPNVSAIDEGAFAECYHLRKVTLGELTNVKGDYEHGDGIFGFDSHSIENIDLELSEKQRIMTKQLIDGRYCWTPTEVPYQMSKDHTNISFLGMRFNSVKCGVKL